jgi:NADH-quinone oxidoreductase subunit J
MPLWLFSFLAVLAVISALGVILQRNPVHCLLGLAVNLLDIGVVFIGLGAVTVGLLQIIVYLGAILVLFLFVIWLLNLQAEGLGGYLGVKLFGAACASALGAELVVMFWHASLLSRLVPAPATPSSISSLGWSLFSNYLIAFEVTSVLLLTAVVGAIGLARRLASSADQADRNPGVPTGLRGGSETVERRELVPESVPTRADSGR